MSTIQIQCPTSPVRASPAPVISKLFPTSGPARTLLANGMSGVASGQAVDLDLTAHLTARTHIVDEEKRFRLVCLLYDLVTHRNNPGGYDKMTRLTITYPQHRTRQSAGEKATPRRWICHNILAAFGNQSMGKVSNPFSSAHEQGWGRLGSMLCRMLLVAAWHMVVVVHHRLLHSLK